MPLINKISTELEDERFLIRKSFDHDFLKILYRVLNEVKIKIKIFDGVCPIGTWISGNNLKKTRFLADTIDTFIDLILFACENTDLYTEQLLKGELIYRVMLYFSGGKILGTTDHVKCAVPDVAKILYFLNRRNVDFKFNKIRIAIQRTTHLSQSKKNYILDALDSIKT